MITIVNTSLHTILLVELYFDVINSDFIKSMARSTLLIKSRAKEHTSLLETKIIQGVHKVLHTFKILISQKPHMVETLDFRQ